MKNKEKFAEELNKICVEGCDTFGLDEDGIPIACHLMSCPECKLSDSIGEKSVYMCCRECRVEWANQEYVPPKFKLPKDTTMEDLVRFYITQICCSTTCTECEFVDFEYCRLAGFIKWMRDNDLMELKEGIVFSKDAK